MEIPQFWITYRSDIPWWNARYALFTPRGEMIGLYFTKRGAIRAKQQYIPPRCSDNPRDAPIVWRDDAY